MIFTDTVGLKILIETGVNLTAYGSGVMKLNWRAPGGTATEKAVVEEDAASGLISYTLALNDVTTAGRYECQAIFYPNGTGADEVIPGDKFIFDVLGF